MLSRNIAFWQKGASHFVCEQMISKPGYDIHCSFFFYFTQTSERKFQKVPFYSKWFGGDIWFILRFEKMLIWLPFFCNMST